MIVPVAADLIGSLMEYPNLSCNVLVKPLNLFSPSNLVLSDLTDFEPVLSPSGRSQHGTIWGRRWVPLLQKGNHWQGTNHAQPVIQAWVQLSLSKAGFLQSVQVCTIWIRRKGGECWIAYEWDTLASTAKLVANSWLPFSDDITPMEVPWGIFS